MRNSQAGRPSQSILLIEDDFHIRQFISVNLTHRHYDIRAASELAEGLPMLGEWRPAIAILELTGPVSEWPTLLASLAYEPGLSSTPLIALCTLPVDIQELQRMNPRVSAVLLKPFSASTLLATIQSVLDQTEYSALT